MPETMSTWWGYRSIAAKACFTEARIAKSPQPGHQVGFSSILKSFRSDMCHRLLADPGRDLVAGEWPAVVLQDFFLDVDARRHADDLGELAREVVLNVDDALRAGEHFFCASGWERPDVEVVQLVDLMALGLEQHPGFMNGAIRRAPADQGHVGVLRSFKERGPNVIRGQIELPH